MTGAPGHGAASGTGATYASSGVHLEAADEAMAQLRDVAAKTFRPEVLGGLGSFAGLFEFDARAYERPVLAASTDGVGTKTVVAQALGRYDTIGIDLVAMCVDDLVCQGAAPLFLLDYLAVGTLDPGQVVELVHGVALGCKVVGAALLGGETAEHPGVMSSGEFDIAGFAVGVVERDRLLGPGRVRVGDVLVGLPSPGLRSNGYTLARQVLLEQAGCSLDDPAWPGATRSLGEELLSPSVLYTPGVLAALDAADVHAAAHITGGGFSGNVPRLLPDDSQAVLDRGTWEVPPIFSEIRRRGGVSDDEMGRVFNLGLGMVLAVGRGSETDVVEALASFGLDARVVGEVRAATSSAAGDDDTSAPVVFAGPPFWPGASNEAAS